MDPDNEPVNDGMFQGVGMCCVGVPDEPTDHGDSDGLAPIGNLFPTFELCESCFDEVMPLGRGWVDRRVRFCVGFHKLYRFTEILVHCSFADNFLLQGVSDATIFCVE